MTIDFLIVGQGLAGSLLAYELIQRGCKVVIIDNGQENASQVAAGLINPITGMRLTKPENINSLLHGARQCYAGLAQYFQQVFHVESPMWRIFRTAEELRYGQKRCAATDYQPYLAPDIQVATDEHGFYAPLGYMVQKQTGYLLTRPLLHCLKDFFSARNSYLCLDFCYQDIQFTPRLRWQQFYPQKIIFCEGHLATKNPWFSWLPLQPCKGEILTLQAQTALPGNLLNNGHWLIPFKNQSFRLGATFDPNDRTPTPTQAGKANLLNNLARLSEPLAASAVIDHQAHIRPGTLDKQPFVGHHPAIRQLGIFNGFGAKGSLYIPQYSQLFADSLLHNSPEPASITRHYATHFPG